MPTAAEGGALATVVAPNVRLLHAQARQPIPDCLRVAAELNGTAAVRNILGGIIVCATVVWTVGDTPPCLPHRSAQDPELTPAVRARTGDDVPLNFPSSGGTVPCRNE